MTMKTGDNLHKARKTANLKKSELAEILHVTAEEIDAWEEGDSEPAQDQWEAIAEALHTPVEWFKEPADQEERSYFKDKARQEEAVKSGRRFLNYANYPVFITFLFLCLGIFLHLWHPAWILFLTIPVFYLPDKFKTFKGLLTSPVVIVIIYLILGFYKNLWHPGWLIFFAIPLLHTYIEK